MSENAKADFAKSVSIYTVEVGRMFCYLASLMMLGAVGPYAGHEFCFVEVDTVFGLREVFSYR
jgi:hypothetical protein